MFSSLDKHSADEFIFWSGIHIKSSETEHDASILITLLDAAFDFTRQSQSTKSPFTQFDYRREQRRLRLTIPVMSCCHILYGVVVTLVEAQISNHMPACWTCLSAACYEDQRISLQTDIPHQVRTSMT